jgi:hypothetical protein
MISQARLALQASMACIVRADEGYVSNFTGSAAGAAFIGLSARYANFQTPPHRSRAGRLRKETATIMKRLRGETNQAVS